ncbi:MAG TPA: tyrosinase family protein, partial [Pyrinomonadaceae bacterium]
QQFRDMHVEGTLSEAHRFPGFLPWHRAYLLDLERELQNIEPRVSLPYWRFDQPAPRLFSKDFIGLEDANGTVEFSSGHPLEKWTTDGVPGINRHALFDKQTSQASGELGIVLSESATLDIGKPDRLYRLFRTMEGQPHGAAHLSFSSISSISEAKEAARDPLFFLLHANVDRLWALWQFLFERFDINSSDTYTTAGAVPRIGHNLQDTMWPWNQITGDGTSSNPRPQNAPGGNFPASTIVTAPGLTPRVRDMIDYQGVFAAASWLGFGYDDVPYSQ